MLLRARAALFVTALLLAGAAQKDAPGAPAVRFAMIESPIHARADLEPVAAWIGGRIGRRVEVVTAADYREMSRLLDSKQVDFAILFPLAFARALNRVPPVELLGCSVRQGKTSYRGYLIARRDGGVRSLKDLRGKRMAFVDEGSTSGYFYPVQVLRDEGLLSGPEDLKSLFSSVEFLGSHEKVVLAVAEGRADAGAVYDLAIADAAERVGVDPASMRILGRTRPIPHEAVVALPGVDPELRRNFQEAILALDTRSEEGRRVLRPLAGNLKLNGFIACDQSVFDPLRGILE